MEITKGCIYQNTQFNIVKYKGYMNKERRPISKIEYQYPLQQQQLDEEIIDASIIHFPWDDDQFSLCLENFPSVKWNKNIYNYPTTKSPLRKYWKGDDFSDEEEEEKEEEKNDLSIQTNAQDKDGTTSISLKSISTTSSVSGSVQSESFKKNGSKNTNKKRKSKLYFFFNKRNINNNSSFPYNNDTNFLNRIEEEAVPNIKEVPKQRGHIEHISPLKSNAVLFDSALYGSSIPSSKAAPSTNSSIRSKRPSIASLHSQVHGSNGSINVQSTVSEPESIEIWKVVRNSNTGSTSHIALPGRRQQYDPTPSRAYHQFQYPPSLSDTANPSTIFSSTGNGAMTPLQQSLHYSQSTHSGFSVNSARYYAQPSPIGSYTSQASSYRSVRVPKNADDLVYISNTSSIYSTDVGPEYTEKNRSYSQYFNPGYHVSGYKKNKNGNKRSNSLLTKLMKNIKHHFAKQPPQ